MKWDELWVGDEVWIISQQQTAHFEHELGNNRVKIRIGSQTFNWPKKDLSLEVPAQSEEIDATSTDIEKISSIFQPEIDLHIEKLTPFYNDLLPFRILEIQMKSFQKFLAAAIQRNIKVVLIIHGKGTGILKQEVHAILKSSPHVFTFFDKNNGGATEVLLK